MTNGHSNCPLCGQPAVLRFSLAHTTVWECTSEDCRLQFANPQPGEQTLERAYADLYYPREKSREIRCGNTPDPIFHQFFETLQSYIGDLRGLRLLDYGCGRGALLHVSLGFGLQPHGIERDPVARTLAAQNAGVRVYASLDELQQPVPAPRFDLAILWTVIEHLRSPWAELARLRYVLRPGGWLLISTMDIRCLRARLQRKGWPEYLNPTHLYYFDRTSLGRTIRAAGFSDYFVWRLKLRHPHHGVVRHCVYNISFALGVADGLYYLCRRTE